MTFNGGAGFAWWCRGAPEQRCQLCLWTEARSHSRPQEGSVLVLKACEWSGDSHTQKNAKVIRKTKEAFDILDSSIAHKGKGAVWNEPLCRSDLIYSTFSAIKTAFAKAQVQFLLTESVQDQGKVMAAACRSSLFRSL
jgi:hypothetical protein